MDEPYRVGDRRGQKQQILARGQVPGVGDGVVDNGTLGGDPEALGDLVKGIAGLNGVYDHMTASFS